MMSYGMNFIKKIRRKLSSLTSAAHGSPWRRAHHGSPDGAERVGESSGRVEMWPGGAAVSGVDRRPGWIGGRGGGGRAPAVLPADGGSCGGRGRAPAGGDGWRPGWIGGGGGGGASSCRRTGGAAAAEVERRPGASSCRGRAGERRPGSSSCRRRRRMARLPGSAGGGERRG